MSDFDRHLAKALETGGRLDDFRKLVEPLEKQAYALSTSAEERDILVRQIAAQAFAAADILTHERLVSIGSPLPPPYPENKRERLIRAAFGEMFANRIILAAFAHIDEAESHETRLRIALLASENEFVKSAMGEAIIDKIFENRPGMAASTRDERFDAFERLQKITETALTNCPEFGPHILRRWIEAVDILEKENLADVKLIVLQRAVQSPSWPLSSFAQEKIKSAIREIRGPDNTNG